MWCLYWIKNKRILSREYHNLILHLNDAKLHELHLDNDVCCIGCIHGNEIEVMKRIKGMNLTGHKRRMNKRSDISSDLIAGITK